jgi:hypothetical protein
MEPGENCYDVLVFQQKLHDTSLLRVGKKHMEQILKIDFLKIEPKTKTKVVGNEQYT